jgi:hypothetical protein
VNQPITRSQKVLQPDILEDEGGLNVRGLKERKRRNAYYNPAPQVIEAIPTDEGEEDETNQQGINVVMSIIMSDPAEPNNLNEALSGLKSQEWTKSIKAEINNCIARDAWKKVPLRDILSEGRKAIRTKTVFKIKYEQDGTQRLKSRIVLLGFSMVPGQDYIDSFSPVATDASVRTVFAISLYIMNQARLKKRISRLQWERKTKVATNLMHRVPICWDWTVEMYDVEAAFLNAEPGHKQYIYVPEAMVRVGLMSQEEASRAAFQLTKSMYGNVDAALRFFIKYKELAELQMVQCKYSTETVKKGIWNY